MHNPVISLRQLQALTSLSQSRLRWSAFLLLTVGLTAGCTGIAQAQTPQTVPPQLKDTLAQIDAAASRHDVQGVLQFYSANFRNSDGLTRASMEQALTQLWKRYPQLSYRTELRNWKNDGNAIVAETVTQVTGTQTTNGMKAKFDSTLRSRQRLENRKIVQQEILAERTQIATGANPPSVQVNLPEQVPVGQEFSFDAIVKEPLGDNLLLGTAMEDTVKPERYTKPTDLKLELLSSGGIFKVGKAPQKPEDRWISAVLIRGDGMTTITQRLRIVGGPAASITPSPN